MTNAGKGKTQFHSHPPPRTPILPDELIFWGNAAIGGDGFLLRVLEGNKSMQKIDIWWRLP